MHFVLTEHDHQITKAAEEYLRRVAEKRRAAPVPRRIQEVLSTTPTDIEPTIRFAEDIKIFIDQNQDFAEGLERGFVYAIIKGRRVRIDVRGVT